MLDDIKYPLTKWKGEWKGVYYYKGRSERMSHMFPSLSKTEVVSHQTVANYNVVMKWEDLYMLSKGQSIKEKEKHQQNIHKEALFSFLFFHI